MSIRDPFAWFAELLEAAQGRETSDPTAMALATVDAAGAPALRMVLLKQVGPAGFVFFTNYGSRKALDIEGNARVALCVHWPALGVQVRIEGRAERVSAAESDAYFATRPRESQVGASISKQSQPLASRAEMEEAYNRQDAALAGRPVPRPPDWGGFRVVPEAIEFWEAGDHRLHDRLRYTRSGDGWRVQRLWP